MSPRRRAAVQTQSPDQPSLPLPEQVGPSDAGGVNAASSRTPRWHRPDNNGVEAAGVRIPDNINPFDDADDPVRPYAPAQMPISEHKSALSTVFGPADLPSDIAALAAIEHAFGIKSVQALGLHREIPMPGLTLVTAPDSDWASAVTGVLHRVLSATAMGCAVNKLQPFTIQRNADRQRVVESPFTGHRRLVVDDEIEPPRYATAGAIVILSEDFTRTSTALGASAETGNGIPRFSDHQALCRQISVMLQQGIGVILIRHSKTELSASLRAACDRQVNIVPDAQLLLPKLMATLFPGQTALLPTTSTTATAASNVTGNGNGNAEGALDLLALDLALRADQTAAQYLARITRAQNPSAISDMSSATTPKAKGFPLQLSAVKGMDQARDWGLDLVADITAFRRDEIALSDIDPGCLFIGPPGTGKTELAQLIAHEAGVPFISASAADWQRQGSLNVFLEAMQETFDEARAARPSIVFLDEVDAFWSRAINRDHNSSYNTQVLTALLQELDGTGDREGVVVIGATNRLENVDPALLRPGRFDREILIERPNFGALQDLFAYYFPNLLDPSALKLVAAEALNLGATGAHIERWARDVRRRARRAGRNPLAADLIAVMNG